MSTDTKELFGQWAGETEPSTALVPAESNRVDETPQEVNSADVELITPEEAELKPTGTSALPPHYGEVYQRKLMGEKVKDLAEAYRVSEVTIWRWCQRYKQEAEAEIVREPVINLIIAENNRLKIIEEAAWREYKAAPKPTAKAAFLAEARRAAAARHHLLVTVGIFPKQPDRIYTNIEDNKPAVDQQAQIAADNATFDQHVAHVLETLRKTRYLR